MANSEDELKGLRTARVAGIILLVAAVLACFSFATIKYGVSIPATRFLDNVHWTIAYVAAAWLGWLGLSTAAAEDRLARLWFARGLTAYAVGQLLWDAQVAVGWNPFPGPSDLFFLCLGPCFALGLWTSLRSRTADSQRRSAIIDTVALSVAVVALSLTLYLPRLGNTGLFTLSVMVAYPMALLAAACIGVILVITARTGSDRHWAYLLLPLMVDGALWMRWNSLTLDNALEDGTWFNFAFSAAALVLGYGSFIWHLGDTDDSKKHRFSEGLLLLLPFFLVVLSVISILFVWRLPNVSPVVEFSVYIGAGVVLILATARQSLLLSERTRLLAAERQAGETEKRYKALFDTAQDSILIYDGKAFVDCNQSAPRMFGCKREDIIGHTPVDFSPKLQPDGAASDIKAAEKIGGALAGVPQVFEWLHQRLDGTPFDAEVSINRLEIDGAVFLQATVRDITQLRRLEQQLFEAQKMESLGTLAGGIAHDFNNILSIITGCAAVIELAKEDPEKIEKKVDNIQVAVQRGAALVRQLLTFARKTDAALVPLQLNDIVNETIALALETFPKTITIETALDEDLPRILSDGTQIHQVLLNLCVNARDAMPHGGRLRFETAVVPASSFHEDRPGLSADQYACIKISDSGHGMDERTRQRIFEPFFTTKGIGKGTGLGLSVAFGIVENHQGFIDVESAVNAGTTFSLYFPIPAGDVDVAEKASPPGPSILVGSGTVLLVEDEEVLNDIVASALRERGYQVVIAANGAEAVEKYTRLRDEITLVLTDFGLPKKSGGEVLRDLKAIDDSVRVIIASGFIEPDTRAELNSMGVAGWLQKPYSIEELLAKVYQVLSG